MFATLLVTITLASSFVRAEEYNLVTCNSAIKVKLQDTGFQLHSHAIAWGSGSKQQSVTTHPNVDQNDSYWVVKVCPYLALLPLHP